MKNRQIAEVLKTCKGSSSLANTPDQTVYPHVTKYTPVMQMHHTHGLVGGKNLNKRGGGISGDAKEMSLGSLCKLAKSV